MLVAILLSVSLFLVFFGSIFASVGLDLLRDGGRSRKPGYIGYFIGVSGLILACSVSFLAGVIA